MSPDKPPAAPPLQLQAAGLRWQVQQAGRSPGEAPGLLLLHGTGSSGLSWRACVAGLAPHFSLLIPDLPGHGGTSAFTDREASLPRMAAAVGDLLAALRWRPALVAGHSAGAAVMVQLCLDGHAQPRGLLAINGALTPLTGLLGAVAPTVARLASRASWLPGWVARHASQPRALDHLIASTGSCIESDGVAHYRELLRQPDHVRGVLDMLAAWRLEELQARLPELRVPLWLAAGLADHTVAPVQSLELARRLKGASFHPLPGLGHLAHEEAPGVIHGLLLGLEGQTRGLAGSAPTGRA